jgi:hypothetical protein
MYNPPPPLTGSPYGAQDFEFLEVRNTGAAPLNLLGFRFNQGIQFDFPNLTLAPGQRTVVVGNRPAFESRYGTGALIAGQYEGRLDNAGERLVLLGPLDESIHDFTYDGQWHPIANGGGFSIVTVNETGPFAQWGQAAGWRPSGVPAGSPGGDDPANPTFPQVVISEVLSRPPTPLRDFIELHNAGLEPADVGGWFLTDSFSVPKKFQIPNGTVLAPGGFVAFTDEAFGGPNAGTPFGLSADGEEAYLFSGNAAGELTGYVHGFAFGPAAEAVSFGRHVTTNGEQHFVAQTALTFGGPNAGPRTGPVVVSEIMYQPAPVFANGAFWNNTEDEYLVLHNLTTASVSLHGWRVQDAVDFVFPADATLQPRGTLVLVGFDPSADPMQMAAFRAKFGVPPGTLIAGPFSRNLNNAGEAIALLRQDGEPGGAGSWILMDEVRYAPDAPWPASAAGQGDALHRFDPAAYGNDPAAWIAAPPHPGVSPLMDTDGDGMPDLWELRHALNPDAPQDASLDLDLDGLTNREEYLAGTDPRDPASVLRLEEIRVASDVTLRFTAVPRRSYVVQFTDSLAAGSWATLATVPPRASTRAVTLHDPDQVNTRYYRVRVEPEP